MVLILTGSVRFALSTDNGELYGVVWDLRKNNSLIVVITPIIRIGGSNRTVSVLMPMPTTVPTEFVER